MEHCRTHTILLPFCARLVPSGSTLATNEHVGAFELEGVSIELADASDTHVPRLARSGEPIRADERRACPLAPRSDPDMAQWLRRNESRRDH